MNKDDLQKFCVADDDVRCASLGRPWSAFEWTYATNGWICVRVPRIPYVNENTFAPDAEKLFKLARNEVGNIALDYIPVPKLAMPEPLICDKCQGTGMFDCPTCNHENDCNDCDGKGTIPDISGVELGEGQLCGNFQIRLLALVQGWEIYPRGPKNSALLSCPGTLERGLLMPRRKE